MQIQGTQNKGLFGRISSWLSPEPRKEQLEIEPAVPSDSVSLSAIHQEALGSPIDIKEQLSLSHATVLKATLGAVPMGMVVMHAQSQTLTEGPETLMGSLVVSNKARGQGIGTALTIGALEHARAQKADSVFLGVEVTNRPATNLYEKLGFERVPQADGNETMTVDDGTVACLYKFEFGESESEEALERAKAEVRAQSRPMPAKFFQSRV